MPETNPPRARRAYDEEIVFQRGFTVTVTEHLGDLVLRVELHDSARVERMPLTPHEARQIASLLRNGTELDHIPHRSCDEALEAARKERDAAIDERDDLLAIIHRDGGHYVGEHGITKAVADAHATWAAVVAERDRLRRELNEAHAELDARSHEAGIYADERDRLRRELESSLLYPLPDIIGRIAAILRGES